VDKPRKYAQHSLEIVYTPEVIYPTFPLKFIEWGAIN
jgi:hypothetical protein